MAQEPEVLDPPRHDPAALALRHPGVPITLEELAALKGGAAEIIDARIQSLKTARLGAIRATYPEDWLLFKAPEEQGGQIVGYLQDSGCQRVRDVFGISIYDVSDPPEKVVGVDPGVFFYITKGDGTCSMTGQTIERQEGGRASTEDFCRGKEGIALELAVRKASRANLDGQIVRELAGLSSVPIAELEAAWTGTHKKVDMCRRGRGFGTKEQRAGGDRADAPKVVPPNCGVCGAVAVFRTSQRGGFYGCSKWKEHENRKWTIDLKEWEKDPRSKPQASTPAAAAPTAPSTPQPKASPGSQLPEEPPPLTDGDIDFGGGRGSSSSGSRSRR